MEQTIEKLEDLKRKNVFRWIEQFRSLVTRHNWTNDRAKKTLLHTVNWDYHEIMEDQQPTTEDCLAALCNHKYPLEMATKLYQRLKHLKQDDYFHIDDYKQDIVDTVQQLATAKMWGEMKC